MECDYLPCDKREIPTPEIARKFKHLASIADEIPPVDPHASIEILIGRDAPELLKVRSFKNGPRGAPWAQKLKLGWTISGQVCYNRIGGPVHISAKRTAISTPSPNQLSDISQEQPIIRGTKELLSYDIEPCPNHFVVKEIAPDVYRTTSEDNQVSLSQNGRRFLEIMKTGVYKNEQGNWEMPLPFRAVAPVVPNNRGQAVKRLNNLLRSFKRKRELEKDYFMFMAKILDRGHALLVPPAEVGNESSIGRIWYLPHFGIYHPRKPKQIRVVFDSSTSIKVFP